MKKAFTMIELIFVIVIIGVLSAVALPKLSATRNDAKVSQLIENAKVTLFDISSHYTATGNGAWRTTLAKNVTRVNLETSCGTPINNTTAISPNTFVLCNVNVICLSFSTINEGNLTITDGVDTSDLICEEVKNSSAVRAISNKTHTLGGQTVHR